MTSPANEYWLAPQLVRARFNRASAHYDASATVVTELRNRLLERLDLVRLTPERVLDLGAGTGIGTRALKKRYPRAHVLALDSAQCMVLQARAQRAWFRPFDLVCADAGLLPLSTATCDLVFSHLMLPWCNSLDAVFAEVARVLRQGGLFSFSSLGPDTARELRRLWQNLDAEVHVHGFMDMHDVGDALVRAGLADPVMDVETVTVTYPSMEHLVRELRALGVTNVAAGRPRGLGSKAKAHRLTAEYESLKRPDGTLPLTIEVVHGHAWSAPRASRGRADEVRIGIDQIQRRR